MTIKKGSKYTEKSLSSHDLNTLCTTFDQPVTLLPLYLVQNNFFIWYSKSVIGAYLLVVQPHIQNIHI